MCAYLLHCNIVERGSLHCIFERGSLHCIFVAFINVVMHGTSESRAGVTLISAANHVVMHGTSESRATHGTSEYRCTVALLPVRGKGGRGKHSSNTQEII